MKNTILFLSALFIYSGLFPQIPEGFSHQAVIRNYQGEILANTDIAIRVSIIQGTTESPAIYVETHTPQSNESGLITYTIGYGNSVEGEFININWSEGFYYLKTEIDIEGGTEYTLSGITQIFSVPYALYAKTAEMLHDGLDEIDPVFSESPAAFISEDDLNKWQEAFSWGDHSEEEYLVEETQILADVLALDNDTDEAQIKNVTDPSDSQDAVTMVSVENIIDSLLARIVALEEVVYANEEFVCGASITFTYKSEEVTYGTILHGGLCWMDRNLGASEVPTDITDSYGWGDYFQWGRLDDGHQNKRSDTTPGPVSQDVPGHDNFLTLDSEPYDWRSPKNDNLWQGAGGINNPCPEGWRLPTEAEFIDEIESWSSPTTEGAFASVLRWPAAGMRHITGFLAQLGTHGYIWTSTVGEVEIPRSAYLFISSGASHISIRGRGDGLSVRCVMDN